MAVKMWDDDMLRAEKVFTDREGPTQLFEDTYREMKEKMDGSYRVINYFGIGGIGKSALLNKLEGMVEPKSFVVYDFEAGGVSEKMGILYDLKERLEKLSGRKFKFPRFSAVLLKYASEKGVERTNKRSAKAIFDNGAVSAFFDALGIFPNIMDAIPVLVGVVMPELGLLTNVLKMIDKGQVALRNQSEKAEIKKLLTQLDAQSIAGIKSEEYFSFDLRDAMKDAKEPLVIFLDTYEYYIDTVGKGNAVTINDMWLRHIIKNSNNVIWVIAGREELSWKNEAETDAGYVKILPCELEDFKSDDALEFLAGAGIESEDLRQGICELTSGTPLYLDICVDIYMEYRNSTGGEKEPDISVFGRDKRELLQRFLKYMKDTTRDVAYLLACMGGWTDDAVMYVANHMGRVLDFSYPTYQEFSKYSFVKRDEFGKFYMHRIVCDVIREAAGERVQKELVPHVLDYYVQQLEKTEGSERVGCAINVLRIFEEYNELFGDIMEAYQQVEKAFVCLKEELCYAEWEQWSTRILRAITGKNVQAEERVRRNLCAMQCGVQRADARMHLGDYRNAHSDAAYTQTFADEMEDDVKPFGLEDVRWQTRRRAEAVLGRAKMALGYYNGAALFAIAIYAENKEKDEKSPETLYALMDVIEVDEELAMYPQMKQEVEELLEKSREVFGEEHPFTWKVRMKQAAVYRHMGQYELAFETAINTYTKQKRVLGEEHLDTLTGMRELAACSVKIGEEGVAEGALKIVIEKLTELLGENHPMTLEAKSQLATTCVCLEDWYKMHGMLREVSEKQKGLVGEDCPATLKTLYQLAIAEYRIFDLQKAFDLFGEVVDGLEKQLGLRRDEHPIVLDCYEWMVRCYEDTDMQKDALTVAEWVYERRKKTLGEEHPDTMRAYETLKRIQYES